MDAQSIAAIPEHDLVPLLLGHGMLSGMILAAAGATTADRFFFRVPVEAMAPKGGEAGDIDALIYTSGAPNLASAYEFKRIKVLPHTFATGTPNKLQELDKAVRQANVLARVGFNRVVLAILLVTDGRQRTDFNFIFRGASDDLLRTVDSAVDLTDLHPDVGMFRIEVVQPVDKDITWAGGIGGKAYRIPTMREQSNELTRRVQEYASQATGA